MRLFSSGALTLFQVFTAASTALPQLHKFIGAMKPTFVLRHASRITLFTRANCGLCDNARLVLSKVWDKRPFHYEEVDVMARGHEKWKDVYEFDVPVVGLQCSYRRIQIFVRSRCISASSKLSP